jgi:hypothetical protein
LFLDAYVAVEAGKGEEANLNLRHRSAIGNIPDGLLKVFPQTVVLRGHHLLSLTPFSGNNSFNHPTSLLKMN